MTYLLVGFFQADSLSTLEDSSRAVQYAFLGWSLSAGDHHDQVGCGCSNWWVNFHFLSLSSLVYMVTHCFPCSTGIYQCCHIVLLWSLLPGCNNTIMLITIWSCNNKRGVWFSCGEICLFIGHRKQQDMGVLLCLVVVLFYVWQYKVQTKAKLDEVYTQVPGTMKIFA